MSVSDLTSPTAVKMAIRECDQLGRDHFLERFGYRLARDYVLRFEGKEYDSKAIVGVAHGFQFPELGPLKPTEFSGGVSQSGAATKAFELGFDVVGKSRRPADWSLTECETTVKAYFNCLAKQLKGESYNREQTCRDVAGTIGRTKGAVDYKFQNIDAVLAKHDLPRMMKAVAGNIQRLLEFVVLDPLADHISTIELTAVPPPIVSTRGLIVDAPPSIDDVTSNRTAGREAVARKINFALRDARNRFLGRAGEKWVVAFEKRRLSEIGRYDLSDRVDWVSERLGDGLGYDIVSFSDSGKELFVEVKTTNAGRGTPFVVSAKEVAVSEKKGPDFRLYRVFSFSSDPHLYILKGALTDCAILTAQQFSAVPK